MFWVPIVPPSLVHAKSFDEVAYRASKRFLDTNNLPVLAHDIDSRSSEFKQAAKIEPNVPMAVTGAKLQTIKGGQITNNDQKVQRFN